MKLAKRRRRRPVSVKVPTMVPTMRAGDADGKRVAWRPSASAVAAQDEGFVGHRGTGGAGEDRERASEETTGRKNAVLEENSAAAKPISDPKDVCAVTIGPLMAPERGVPRIRRSPSAPEPTVPANKRRVAGEQEPYEGDGQRQQEVPVACGWPPTALGQLRPWTDADSTRACVASRCTIQNSRDAKYSIGRDDRGLDRFPT